MRRIVPVLTVATVAGMALTLAFTPAGSSDDIGAIPPAQINGSPGHSAHADRGALDHSSAAHAHLDTDARPLPGAGRDELTDELTESSDRLDSLEDRLAKHGADKRFVNTVEHARATLARAEKLSAAPKP